MQALLLRIHVRCYYYAPALLKLLQDAYRVLFVLLHLLLLTSNVPHAASLLFLNFDSFRVHFTIEWCFFVENHGLLLFRPVIADLIIRC